MTITSYSFIYGNAVPYSVLFEFLHGKKYSGKHHSAQHDWMVDFLHYSSGKSMVSDVLRPIHDQLRDPEKVVTKNYERIKEFFMINLPHDQIGELLEGRDDFMEEEICVMGVLQYPKTPTFIFDCFELHPDCKKYSDMIESLKDTDLYKFLRNPCVCSVQNDCGCCS